jgi:hypothetical protein
MKVGFHTAAFSNSWFILSSLLGLMRDVCHVLNRFKGLFYSGELYTSAGKQTISAAGIMYESL